jgi:hypothetical protein
VTMVSYQKPGAPAPPRPGRPQRGSVRKRRLDGRVRRRYRPAPAPMEGAGALNASPALALDLKLPLSLRASRREVAPRTRLWAIGSPTRWTRGFGLTGCSTIVVNEAQLFDWASRFSCKLKGDRRDSNPRPSEPQSDATSSLSYTTVQYSAYLSEIFPIGCRRCSPLFRRVVVKLSSTVVELHPIRPCTKTQLVCLDLVQPPILHQKSGLHQE